MDYGDGVVEGLADVQDPGRTIVENHTKPGRCAAPFDIVILPVPSQQWTDRARRRQSVYVLGGVFLHKAAVREHDAEHGTGGAIRRAPEKGRTDRSAIQRAGNDLRGLARREGPGEHASGQSAGSPGQRDPAWVNDGRCTDTLEPGGSVGWPQPPEGVVDRETERVAHRG